MPIIETVEDVDFATLPPGQVVALDLGAKTIGIAISDPGWSIAMPVETLRRKKFTIDAETLVALLTERNVSLVVLGLPLNMDGSEGPRAQATRAFARNFTQRTDIPITYWDERLSTAAAERLLISQDTSRAKRREVIDAVAAAHILEGALARLRQLRTDAASAPGATPLEPGSKTP